MPELPEVETIRRGLQHSIVGQQIAAVEVLVARSFPGYCADVEETLVGATITGTSRRGKLLMLHLEKRQPDCHSLSNALHAKQSTAKPDVQEATDACLDNQFILMIHLRMTGQLLVCSDGGGIGEAGTRGERGVRERHEAPEEQGAGDEQAGRKTPGTAEADMQNGLAAAQTNETDEQIFGGGYPSRSLIAKMPDKSTRVIIRFSDHLVLFFNDQRKFGYLKLMPSALLGEDDFLCRLGPEPLDAEYNWRKLRERLPLRSNQAIKAALLDQAVVAGVGNIYADESLFLAGIHPERPVSSLSVPAIKRLCLGIQTCMQQSLDAGGATARDYVDSEGMRGEYLDLHAKVYGRTGQPCPKCGRPISKIRVVGRGTHLCTHCQE